MVENRSMPPGVIIPVLAYPDVAAAVAWLCEVFGFAERLLIGSHRAQLCFAGASVVVADLARDPDGGGRSPWPAEDQVARSIMVRVDDVDRHYERSSNMGARIISAPQTYPFGERQYTVLDPGGHVWTFSQAVADVAPEEWGGRIVGECDR